MTHAHTEPPIGAIDAHAFVAKLFSGVPEDDRVAAMERYILAKFEGSSAARFETAKETITVYEAFLKTVSGVEGDG